MSFVRLTQETEMKIQRKLIHIAGVTSIVQFYPSVLNLCQKKKSPYNRQVLFVATLPSKFLFFVCGNVQIDDVTSGSTFADTVSVETIPKQLTVAVPLAAEHKALKSYLHHVSISDSSRSSQHVSYGTTIAVDLVKQ